MTYFQRQGWSASAASKAADFLPGDVVAWNLGGGVTHIGIISDRRSATGTPLVIHNIGAGVQEENILFSFAIIGHYRPQFSHEQIGVANGNRPVYSETNRSASAADR